MFNNEIPEIPEGMSLADWLLFQEEEDEEDCDPDNL
jgi:hypothetical protein